MIEIKCAAPDTAATLCGRAGVPLQTVLSMTEREDLLGFVCMTQDGEEVTLSYLEAPDTALVDALLRAALNSARSNGAVFARIAWCPLLSHMRQKQYLTESKSDCVEIANFFAKSACKA